MASGRGFCVRFRALSAGGEQPQALAARIRVLLEVLAGPRDIPEQRFWLVHERPVETNAMGGGMHAARRRRDDLCLGKDRGAGRRKVYRQSSGGLHQASDRTGFRSTEKGRDGVS